MAAVVIDGKSVNEDLVDSLRVNAVPAFLVAREAETAELDSP